MKTYKISPDYCATGCWESYYMTTLECELPEYVPDSIRVALKYWVHTWEFSLSSKSEQYKKNWIMDGEILVRELNELEIDKFIYDVSETDAIIQEK